LSRGVGAQLVDLYWFDVCWSRFEQICNALTAAVLHPVAITHGHNRDDGNREKDTGDTGEFFAREDREDHREWMQMNTLAD